VSEAAGSIGDAARHPLPARTGLRWHGGAGRFALGLLGLAVILLLWWAGIALFAAPGGLATRFAPDATFASLVELLSGSDLLHHAAVSLQRILVGLGLALVIGVPVGLTVGLNGRLEAATSPAFQFLRMISPLSWMPIAVMALGVGDRPIYFLLTFAAVWPILLSTAAGVRQLDPAWLALSQSLAGTRWETLIHIVLPGVVAHVLTGVRLAVGVLWIVLVPCEMLGVSAGLGYFVLDTRDRLAYSELMATVLLIGMLGFLLDVAVRAIHARWSPGS
jgi:NitT/TauT family transport system permease protein